MASLSKWYLLKFVKEVFFGFRDCTLSLNIGNLEKSHRMLWFMEKLRLDTII